MEYLLKKVLLFIFSTFFIYTNAQVTIGSGIAPQEGVLLDLKEFNDATALSGGKTTDKGLLLPRLTLTSRTSLIDIPAAANQNTPLQYRGLIVYNIDSTRQSQGLYKGVNVWDGAKWNNIYYNNSPKSFVRAVGSSTMAIVNLTLLTGWKKLVFTQEDFDENSEYDNTTNVSTGGQFIPKQDGLYSIYAQYTIDPSLLAAGTFGIGIFKKNTDGTYSLIAQERYANISVLTVGILNPPTRSVQTLLKLKAGDIIVVGAYSSVTLSLLTTGSDVGSSSYLTIQQVK